MSDYFYTGGEFNKKSLSLQGQLAKSNIAKYNVHLALISCKGLSLEKGVLDSNEEEAEIKKAMLTQAEEVALLVDSSKFGQSAFVSLIDLEKVIISLRTNVRQESGLNIVKLKGFS
ncbi:MAG: hypothetical protein ACLTCI_09220 [[Clostridium] nexile]